MSPVEVKKAANQMKSGKAPGPANIPTGLIKAAPEHVFGILATLFTICLKADSVPREWKQSFISSHYKNGSTSECKNYRGISLLC